MNMGNLEPGARIIVRDAEWLVCRIDRTSTGSQALSVVGLSELVKEKEAVFLQDIEKQSGSGIEVLDPAETKLVPDTSSSLRDSLLYFEGLLRQTPPYAKLGGFSKLYFVKDWDEIKAMTSGAVERKVTEDFLPDGPRERTIAYEAPFDRCDREQVYATVWQEFEKPKS